MDQNPRRVIEKKRKKKYFNFLLSKKIIKINFYSNKKKVNF
jgi:hypothetical protein